MDQTAPACFCTLEYVPRFVTELGTNSWSAQQGQILLIAIMQKDAIHLFAHPTPGQIVVPEELPYIEALVDDFSERASQHPDDLFRQLCSLSTGLLLTREVSEETTCQPEIKMLISDFKKIY